MGSLLKNKKVMCALSAPLKIINGVKNHKGFLLIEVLIAITIIAVSLTLITRSLVATMRATAFVGEYTLAAFKTENIMFDFLRNGLPSCTNKSIDDMFEYQFETTNYPEIQDLNKLSLQVMWRRGTQFKKLSLMTFVPAKPL